MVLTAKDGSEILNINLSSRTVIILFEGGSTPSGTKMTILVFYSSITQIIRQQKLNTNAKLNKKDKFNRYAIDDDKNAKYNPNIEPVFGGFK